MGAMEIPALLKTKTFWGGIASIAAGSTVLFTSESTADSWQEAAGLIAVGINMIFLRAGIKKIEDR